jgi:hypothetical protein
MENRENMERFCNYCQVIHEINAFTTYTKTRKFADGSSKKYTCYKCKIYTKDRIEKNREKRKEYLKKNKEQIQKKQKEYFEKNKEHLMRIKKEYEIKNKENIKIKRNEYNEKNKDILKIRNKVHRQKNAEKISKKKKEYNEKNKEKISIKRKKYHRTIFGYINSIISSSKKADKKKGYVCDIDYEYLLILLEKQNYKCSYCNHDIHIAQDDKKLSQASLDRYNCNFGHSKGNVKWTCFFCNFAKNSVSDDIFKQFLDVLFGNNTIYQDDYEKDKYFVALLQNNCKKTDIKKFGEDCVNDVITTNEIRDMINKQNNKCAITGLPLINTILHKFPFKPSVDRIKNNIGHTKDNCQIVCLAIQMGKNSFSDEEVKNYIAEIKKINKN